MCKCIGCGAKLQTQYEDKEGYTPSLNNDLCLRCFKIRNYNEYKVLNKDNVEFINILEKINCTDDLVVLVLTKRDILPKSCYDENLIKYFNNYNLNIIDTVIISSKNNYNYDLLYNKINEYKKSNNVYVVGYTNSGKSTMINKMLYNYSDNTNIITTSNLPSTTVDCMHLKVNDSLTIIDTPGLLDAGDIINHLNSKYIKKVIPNEEIKPVTYQIKQKQYLFIDDLLRIDVLDETNITIYKSNRLLINRVYKETNDLKNLKKHEIKVDKDTDIVIQGLCFIKVSIPSSFILYVNENVDVFTRKSLI